MEKKLLAIKIRKFVSEYAGIRPDWDAEFDSEDEKYTSPDASEMIACANLLDMDIVPDKCFSDWGSGGYIPYTSENGKKEHDLIMSEIYTLINNK